ncbi:Uncharacterized protein APZ42_009842, partial [Daphnia magna]
YRQTNKKIMANSTAKDVGHIEKFDGRNFPSWKYGIWMFLEKNQLIPVVDGRETEPKDVRIRIVLETAHLNHDSNNFFCLPLLIQAMLEKGLLFCHDEIKCKVEIPPTTVRCDISSHGGNTDKFHIQVQKLHPKTKHIDVKYHLFVRDKQTEGILDVKYVCTNNQLADIFTKPLPAPRFERLREEIGVV